MNITRRSAMGVLAGGAPAIILGRAVGAQLPAGLEIEKGPFQATRESLKAYVVPQWYRDAKFGLWAHWGPQSAAEYGDWYARNMYMEGSRQYKYHVADLRTPLEGRIQGRDRDLEGRQVQCGAPDRALQEGRREVLLQHGGAPRQLRPVEFEVPAALELGRLGAEDRRRRAVPEGDFEGRAEVRRQRASVQQLQLVFHIPRERQGGPARRRAVRRNRSQVRGPVPRAAQGFRPLQGAGDGTQRAGLLEAALFQTDQTVGGRLPARPALHGRRDSVRGIRPEPGGASLQFECQAARRQGRGRLHQ